MNNAHNNLKYVTNYTAKVKRKHVKNIIKRGDCYYTNVAVDGKRIRKSAGRSRPLAIAMVKDLLLQRHISRNGIGLGNISWDAFKIRYFEYCQTDKDPKTYQQDARAIRCLDETVQIHDLAQITPDLLERVKFKWKENGFTQSVITRHIHSIKTAMHRAEDWKYIGVQNWRIVKVQEPAARLAYFTMEQYERLLGVCRGIWHMAAMLMGRAGLRGGETYYLEWTDIDFNLHKLHIQRKDFWKPKGRNGGKERWVDLDADLESYLRSRQKAAGFLLNEERCKNLKSFLANFAYLIHKAGLKGSAHTLRHTFASHLVSNGASLSQVAGLLGVTEQTAKIYAHLMPHATRNAINKLPPLMHTLGTAKTAPRGQSVTYSTVQIDGGNGL